MSFTDADLIARALSLEDQNAFGELVRRNQSPVRAFLAKMTRGDTHLADDLAQRRFQLVVATTRRRGLAPGLPGPSDGSGGSRHRGPLGEHHCRMRESFPAG